MHDPASASLERVNVAYFEMIGGASGNMLLGALIDAGADLARIENALRTIPLQPWTTELRRVDKLGIAATYFDFVISAEPVEQRGRHLADILTLLDGSGLSADAKTKASAIYARLGHAEAKVHGGTVESVHFHEVGAADAILDVAGICVALEMLEVERVHCSPFPLGRGTVSMHHGIYPNPPPATAELLRGMPTYDAGIDAETITPTGAAVLATLVAAGSAGLRPALRTDRIGYGAGRSDFTIPNVVRASIGTVVGPGSGSATIPDEVAVLEANIDDMSPQHFELAIERVLAAGAYDVWLAPVTMKKMRPAVLFGAVAPVERESEVAAAMLAQTSTLGVRVRRERRHTLARELETIATPLGRVRVKTTAVDGQRRRTLEYDDVAGIARELGRPIAEVAALLEEHISHP
jgi:uncharacterized protein (TIGR00299 family) protein